MFALNWNCLKRSRFRVFVFLVFALSTCRTRDDTHSKQQQIDEQSGKRFEIRIDGPVSLNGSQIEFILRLLDFYRSTSRSGKPGSVNEQSAQIDPVFDSLDDWHTYRASKLSESLRQLEELSAALRTGHYPKEESIPKEIFQSLTSLRLKYEKTILALQTKEKRILEQLECLRRSQSDLEKETCQREISSAELDLIDIRDQYQIAKTSYDLEREDFFKNLRQKVNIEWDQISCVLRPESLKKRDSSILAVYLGDPNPSWKAEEYAIPNARTLKYVSAYKLPQKFVRFFTAARDIKNYDGGDRTIWRTSDYVKRVNWEFESQTFDIDRFLGSAWKKERYVPGLSYSSIHPSFDFVFVEICKDVEKQMRETYAQGFGLFGSSHLDVRVLSSQCQCQSHVRNLRVHGQVEFSYPY